MTSGAELWALRKSGTVAVQRQRTRTLGRCQSGSRCPLSFHNKSTTLMGRPLFPVPAGRGWTSPFLMPTFLTLVDAAESALSYCGSLCSDAVGYTAYCAAPVLLPKMAALRLLAVSPATMIAADEPQNTIGYVTVNVAESVRCGLGDDAHGRS
ncbi:uncharacterized protein B0I36DRAFT_321627 [Microdochium trichocladiopsis]|uniref:Uncharacterized protein n=1 Tax=Microdochium trichocladiopsis TaxID=1682393 RepID=A0A9P8YBZ5_9PEZI|nr:uncharacterized protein B0I36DRAFT_321627 [Microdochium trichocladiopsis]KAH7033524.1 hypothetical protein B0I36DRAFT_321627 [Microdochium trichocladiopsis]